ncbi:hypothetical protein ES702_06510 [subsurface metagenome]
MNSLAEYSYGFGEGSRGSKGLAQLLHNKFNAL